MKRKHFALCMTTLRAVHKGSLLYQLQSVLRGTRTQTVQRTSGMYIHLRKIKLNKHLNNNTKL